jgi:hypothetical protein
MCLRCVVAVADAAHTEVGVALGVPLKRGGNMLLIFS